ncbi:MAG TPA: zf-TFIIB domain-containing protein [Candidatus Cryosericum sp.]|nr:zf-TFIIB domain-containing protein [Candidatus Cryosericum sp.]
MGATMWCSGCGTPLAAGEVFNIPVEACSECGGTWLEEGRLKWIIEVGPKSLPADRTREVTRFTAGATPAYSLNADETRRIVKCPYCVCILRPVNYSANSGVAIYRCIQDHGVWIPKGGIDRLIVFIDTWDRYLQSAAPYYIGLAQLERKRFLRKLV